MKISELLERLGELQGEHGDVEVYVHGAFELIDPILEYDNEYIVIESGS